MKPPGTLLVFWDYDTQWGTDADRRRGLLVAPNVGAAEFACTERLLALHAEFAIPACFAVVGAAARPGRRPYHDAAQIRRIHAEGHEVASHGLEHEWLPALGWAPLRRVLAQSRDLLEQCISAPVNCFVPPYNQPFDYPAGWSFSRSERSLATAERADVTTLCSALAETGYEVCRLAYRSVLRRAVDRIAGREVDRPARTRRIRAITCVRLNAGCGFGDAALDRLRQAALGGGLVVAYGHPHSLYGDTAQHERFLVPFLREAAMLRGQGRLRIGLPRDLIPQPVAT
jgi:hypothetical protein